MSTLHFAGLKSFDGSVSEQEFNRLVDALQSIAITAGATYTIKRTPIGTTLETAGKSSGGGTIPPFTITVFQDGVDTKIKLTPGAVNELLPTNMFSELTIADTGTYYVKADIVTDGEKITSSSIDADTTAPVAQTPTPFALPTSVEILIGIVKDGKAYRTLDEGSIYLEGHEQYRTDKSPPAQPGEMVYTPFYAWTKAA